MCTALLMTQRNTRASARYNAMDNVVQGVKPPHEYAMIVCAMRFFDHRFSEYYKHFCEVHSNETPERQFGLASVALVASALACRDSKDLPIVGIDIAGAERGFPAHTHSDAFRYAHKRFLNKTVHAGESYGPESIFEAITDLNAERIGHGYNLFYADQIENPEKLKALGLTPEKYVAELVQYIAEHRITLEVCLSSNLQTLPELKGDVRNHPIQRMLDHRLAASLHTDNRLVSNTTVCREVRMAADGFDLTAKQMKDMILGAFKGSFFPKDYIFKRNYVRRVINYYEALEKEYMVKDASAGKRHRNDSFAETGQVPDGEESGMPPLVTRARSGSTAAGVRRRNVDKLGIRLERPSSPGASPTLPGCNTGTPAEPPASPPQPGFFEEYAAVLHIAATFAIALLHQRL